MFRRRNAAVAVMILVFLGAAAGNAQIPERVNYQVMLTDDADQPLAGQTVQIVFGIFDAESGGSALWTETQNVETNSIGVASVILGSVTPIGIEFDGPRWLEIEIEGETLSPRRELVAVPFARQAHNSAHLGGETAASYALSEPLSTPGTVNDSGNPVDWTKLKGVPAGFSDGVDDVGGGAGDGYSLDAADGDPTDVVYVEAAGNVTVNGGSAWSAALEVTADRDSLGVYVFSHNSDPSSVALLAVSDSTTALVGNSYETSQSYIAPTYPAGVAGYGNGPADGGFFAGVTLGDGVECMALGSGAALRATGGFGDSGYFTGGKGVVIDNDIGYPTLNVSNLGTTGYCDAAYFSSLDGAYSGTWTIYSVCYGGVAARFEKMTDDDQYPVTIYGANAGAEGLYVGGSIYTTAPAAREVKTSRGAEAVFGVTSPDVSVVASGRGVMSEGRARVEFDRLYAESFERASDLRITATPIGAWSALYVDKIDASGFTLMTGAGAQDVEFSWIAVATAAGYAERPSVTVPDLEYEKALAAEKNAAAEARKRASAEGGNSIERVAR